MSENNESSQVIEFNTEIVRYFVNLTNKDAKFKDAARLVFQNKGLFRPQSTIQRHFQFGDIRFGYIMEQLTTVGIFTIGKTGNCELHFQKLEELEDFFIKCDAQPLLTRKSSLVEKNVIATFPQNFYEENKDKINFLIRFREAEISAEETLILIKNTQKELELSEMLAAGKKLKHKQEEEKIRNSILEKERKKELQKNIYQTLIAEGKILNSAIKKREHIPQNIMDKVWNRDGGRCVKCDSSENLEFDHIIPYSKGGASSYRNLQILCKKCNVEKSNKIG